MLLGQYFSTLESTISTLGDLRWNWRIWHQLFSIKLMTHPHGTLLQLLSNSWWILLERVGVRSLSFRLAFAKNRQHCLGTAHPAGGQLLHIPYLKWPPIFFFQAIWYQQAYISYQTDYVQKKPVFFWKLCSDPVTCPSFALIIERAETGESSSRAKHQREQVGLLNNSFKLLWLIPKKNNK